MWYRYSVLLMVLLASPVAAQVCYTYRTTNILTPAGLSGQTSLEAINTGGMIVGRYANQDPPDGYALIPKARVTNYTLTRYRPIAGKVTLPRGINRQKDTVGEMGLKNQPGKFTGYVRLATGGVQLVDVPGSIKTEALGINSLRDVVGYYYGADGLMHGFWRYKMQYLTIDAPGAEGTTLTGINLYQDLIGWYEDLTGTHGLHIVDGVTATLDVPGALVTFLLDLNDAGAIVGLQTQGEYGSGFLYEDGAFYPITPGVGEIHSEAVGINNAGQIVGNYLDASGGLFGFIATRQPTCTTAPALVALAGP